MDPTKVTSGFYMSGEYSAKNVIEDFMKTEYQEGLRNEFAIMDALINKLSKDTITGKLKYKAFALGITDNVRAIGENRDQYELGFGDYLNKGVETVEAQFDTTKIMATFAVTDEVLMKGTGDGSLFDVVKDSLNRMELTLKHTLNRFTYGSKTGLIGGVKDKADGSKYLLKKTVAEVATKPVDPRGSQHNVFYGSGNKTMLVFKMRNSHSVLPGMGIMIETLVSSHTSALTSHPGNKYTAASQRIIGRIFQKSNPSLHEELIYLTIEKVLKATVADGVITAWETDSGGVTETAAIGAVGSTNPYTFTSINVFSRQLVDTTAGIQREYTGLEDIICTQNNTIYGVDRSLYTSFNCLQQDLQDSAYLNEELLRDMADNITLSTPEGVGVNLVAANHRIISTVEKSLYQFREYSLDTKANGFQLGRPEIRFDNFQLMKDKYARDNNVYMVDTTQIGELIRRDWQWITNGEKEGVLQRRPGTELYEGIMNKYADTYLDSWRSHAVIKNCKVPTIGAVISGTYPNPSN
jgi:hypothetical protein